MNQPRASAAPPWVEFLQGGPLCRSGGAHSRSDRARLRVAADPGRRSLRSLALGWFTPAFQAGPGAARPVRALVACKKLRCAPASVVSPKRIDITEGACHAGRPTSRFGVLCALFKFDQPKSVSFAPRFISPVARSDSLVPLSVLDTMPFDLPAVPIQIAILPRRQDREIGVRHGKNEPRGSAVPSRHVGRAPMRILVELR